MEPALDHEHSMVFQDIPGLSLATEIGIVDSILYSMASGPIVIVLVGMIWSIPGAIVGSVVGCALSGLLKCEVPPRATSSSNRAIDMVLSQIE